MVDEVFVFRMSAPVIPTAATGECLRQGEGLRSALGTPLRGTNGKGLQCIRLIELLEGAFTLIGFSRSREEVWLLAEAVDNPIIPFFLLVDPFF